MPSKKSSAQKKSGINKTSGARRGTAKTGGGWSGKKTPRTKKAGGAKASTKKNPRSKKAGGAKASTKKNPRSKKAGGAKASTKKNPRSKKAGGAKASSAKWKKRSPEEAVLIKDVVQYMKAFHRKAFELGDGSYYYDHTKEPLRSYVLTMDQVRALEEGTLVYIDTLAPQSYERHERLHQGHEYLEGDGSTSKGGRGVGYFYPDESGFAVTGSGDVWFVVREGLVDAIKQTSSEPE
jgi:hypothetical protein